MDIWQYLGRWLAKSIHIAKPLTYTQIASFAASIATGIIASLQPEWAQDWQLMLWLKPVLVFGLAILAGLILAPYYLYGDEMNKRQKAERQINELTRKGVELYFDENSPCKMEQSLMTGGAKTQKRVTYRVGLKTSGSKTVDDVSVSLKAIDSRVLRLRDRHLNPSDSRFEDPPTFRVNPSKEPSRYVEIVSYDEGDEYIGVHYYRNYHTDIEHSHLQPSEPSVIEAGEHTLTLLVEGRDMPAFERDFVVKVEDAKLLFYPT